MHPADPAPQSVYTSRLQARQQRQAALARQDGWLAHARLLVFALGLGLLAAVSLHGLAGQWLFLPTGIFAGLVLLHERVSRRLADNQRRLDFYTQGLQRLRGQLPAAAFVGPEADPQHPYALDLDLFGRAGIFGFVCTAQTSCGQRTLADWLLRSPTSLQVAPLQARQAAVQALQPHLDLREDLAALGPQMRANLHDAMLQAWAAAASPPLRPWRHRLLACNLLLGGSLLAYAAGLLPGLGLLPALALQWLMARRFQQFDAQAGLSRDSAEPRRELPMLRRVIARLQQEDLRHPALADWVQPLLRPAAAPPAPASPAEAAPQDQSNAQAARPLGSATDAAAAIAHFERLSLWAEALKNQLFAPVGWLLLWGPHTTLNLEQWRQTHGPHLAPWLQAIGAIEALLSLGGYAFERPADVFAELHDGNSSAAPCFDGAQLGHPLLPAGSAVCNDVQLDADARLLIVSGSNMSGKSTLLRTVGINAVLALAGAPVCARRLRLSPLCIGATLRIQDSLQAGTSRFYAEIQRLKQLKDAAGGPIPLLFLLDEILHGTNSHDRAVGAEALLEGLLGQGAIGLVTTHDLSLSSRAAALQARNVHFADDWVDGSLRFDYRMRTGVVQKSNALALMQQAGLL